MPVTPDRHTRRPVLTTQGDTVRKRKKKKSILLDSRNRKSYRQTTPSIMGFSQAAATSQKPVGPYRTSPKSMRSRNTRWWETAWFVHPLLLVPAVDYFPLALSSTGRA